MPTVLPNRLQAAAAAQRLSWPDTTRLLIMLVRVRWLNHKLEGARRRVAGYGLDTAGPNLVVIARRWLKAHEAIATLLGIPEPPEVEKVRATLRPLDEVRKRAAVVPSPGRPLRG